MNLENSPTPGEFPQRSGVSISENNYREVKKEKATKEELPEISFKIPGKLKQFGVFIKRDILKKLSDTQYLVINFLEAPLAGFSAGIYCSLFRFRRLQ